MADPENSSDATAPTVEVCTLGPLEIRVDGERTSLPRSKKTRALLAYLATTGRAHRRERLCSLLWDVTDDPRGALRWSLSRIRNASSVGAERIEANREQVAFRTDGVRIDAHELRGAIRTGLGEISLEELERLASLPRGEFLEGLDLPDFSDFHAWCVAEREELREHHSSVLSELITRLESDPQRAVTYARLHARIDPFQLATQERLLSLLLAAGKLEEARQRFEGGQRLFREMGVPGVGELEDRWREMLASHEPGTASRPAPPARHRTRPIIEEQRTPSVHPFVGRRQELDAMERLIDEARAKSAPRVALIIGEPGAGKSRLAERVLGCASSSGFEVFSGRAHEAEGARPYGPWVDALGVGIHELVAAPEGTAGGPSRETLFAAVLTEISARTRGQHGAVLVLDDLQWLDRDSAELLHYVARSYSGALLILLLARPGEFNDNEAAVRAVRGIRKERGVEEVELGPLSAEEIGELVGRRGDIDVAGVHLASAGNPLYALELARAHGSGGGVAASSVAQLVRERIEHLPEPARDILRWGAVLGHAIDPDRLEALSSLDADEIVFALEQLEHHAFLRIDATRASQRYVFAHDVVREAVYRELSHPRRRLMHRKVAHLLEPRTSDAAVATEVAHHAGLAGEADLGVRACVVAGQQSLRLFANGDAEALARRGLRLAEELDDAERIAAALDLLHIQFAARTPERESAARQVRELAERALDLGLTHASRLGFQMLSFLRWESASMADAHKNIMQAERVSRRASPDERAATLAHAAKCLVLLERNLGQAHAFALEADTLALRAGEESSAVAFANGMLAAHRGEFDAAVSAFQDARDLARNEGERLVEFAAIQHEVMLAIDRGCPADVVDLAGTLADLGERVRKGAEAPTGRALSALVRLLTGDEATESALRDAVEELRSADAKYELSFLFTRWAAHELAQGRVEAAGRHARDALEVAELIGRASETALSHALLAECARASEDDATRALHLERLQEFRAGELSQAARARIEPVLTSSERTA